MPRKRKAVSFEDLGGELVWTDEGITLFIPQEMVQSWEAAEVEYDPDEESIRIYAVEED
jgi:hypothetical protein